MATNKKLITLTIVTVAVTSFLGGYLLTLPAQQSTDIIQEQRGALIDRFSSIDNDSTPTPLPPGLLQASNDSALALTNATDGDSVLYYHPSSGYVSSLNLETRTKTIVSSVQLSGLTEVIWSPDKNRVITISRGPNGPIYKYFDYTTRKNGTLGANIKDVVFSPDSQSVAIVRSGGSDSRIEISNFENLSSSGDDNPKIIFKTRLDSINLYWQTDHTLSFTANDTNGGTRSFYILSDNGDLKQLVDGETDLSIQWSPDGSRFLFSTRKGDSQLLNIFDSISLQSKIISLEANTSNCAWFTNERNIICATESGGDTSITKIDVLDNTSTILFSNLIITPKEVFLSHLENFLVILNSMNEGVWALKL